MNSLAGRCPACGEPLEQPELARCPLCGIELQVGAPTGHDVTPYSKAVAAGEPRWWEMATWTCLAGGGRLKHLAMIRASVASTRFARISLVFLASALALVELARKGWWEVTSSGSTVSGQSVRPAGRGWLHVVTSPGSSDGIGFAGTQTDLWWNITHAVIAMAVAMLVGWLAMSLVLFCIKLGATWAYARPYRNDGRMTAAIDYSTAWCIPVFLGGIVVALRPISVVGDIAEWSWYPPASGLEVVAGALAGFGMMMWWFWLIRLGNTAPPNTRGRVIAFFIVGAPLCLGSAAMAWWLIIEPMYTPLFDSLGVSF